jgi:hypothetical protein
MTKNKNQTKTQKTQHIVRVEHYYPKTNTDNVNNSYIDVIYPDLDVDVLMMLTKWYITGF